MSKEVVRETYFRYSKTERMAGTFSLTKPEYALITFWRWFVPVVIQKRRFMRIVEVDRVSFVRLKARCQFDAAGEICVNCSGAHRRELNDCYQPDTLSCRYKVVQSLIEQAYFRRSSPPDSVNDFLDRLRLDECPCLADDGDLDRIPHPIFEVIITLFSRACNESRIRAGIHWPTGGQDQREL